MSDLNAPVAPRPKRSEQRRAAKRNARRRPSAVSGKFATTTVQKKRWKKRVFIGSVSLLLIIVLLVGGVYFYARWRLGQIHREKVAGLATPVAGQPFNVLLVGSDSRQFVDNSGEAGSFGSAEAVSGQRSDVIIVARIVPATHQIKLMSIPRDTWVDIPGNVQNVSGPNRINAAYNNGASLLVQTITDLFHIPISYYTEVGFPGFAGMVNAVGGVGLDFRYPVKDAYSGLDITTTGCQLVNGTEALALVRSRHLYYEIGGSWYYDGLSDFSRIQRQDAFFRAIVSKIRGAITDPFALNSFLGSATKYLTIDQTLSQGEIISLMRIFHSFNSNELVTETLPTAPYTTSAGADVLLPAPAPDQAMISAFLAFGTKTANTTAAVTGGATTNAVLTAETSASNSVTPVTSLINEGATPPVIDYNTQAEPWNPTPCNP